MPTSALKCAQDCPKNSFVLWEGRRYALNYEAGSWRLRSRSAKYPADYRTGLKSLTDAKKAARDWLSAHAENPILSRKGGGSLDALVKEYQKVPKRAGKVAERTNISRLRTVCRLALGKELHEVTCREVNPALWETYQRKALVSHGREFNFSTRYRENITINSAVRGACNLFLDSLVARYRAAGLDVRPDARKYTVLPEPHLQPSQVDDAALVKAIRELPRDALWQAVACARFAGLRCREIEHLRGTWIEERDSAIYIRLRDRPEENWWNKTNAKPYSALVIDPELADSLRKKIGSKDYVIAAAEPRHRWFNSEPQGWLKRHGITDRKSLHRLRGLYADAIKKLTEDAMAAHLAGVRAAQKALGHTTSATTEKHYLSQ